MKRVNSILIITLFVITGGVRSAGSDNRSTDEIVVIDVTKSYPKKELKVQDVMDIEYIPLETTGEFLVDDINISVIDISDHYVAVVNMREGSIFIFDRKGKGLKKMNHKGQGAGEYLVASKIVIDEDSNELFVLDLISKKIFVYDLLGKFIRSFKFQDDYNANSITNFDKNHLMGTGFYIPPGAKSPFFIFSKQDGSMKELVDIPYEKQVSISLKISGFPRPLPINPTTKLVTYRDKWILADFSSDTLFMYSPDYKMTPILARTPSIQSMDPKEVLRPCMFTDRYYFMESTKYASNTLTTTLMYDRKETAVFEYTMFNEDYSDEPIILSEGHCVKTNNEIALFEVFESFKLVEANKAGKLKGGLKEVASKLKEDDNPVIMLLKNKK